MLDISQIFDEIFTPSVFENRNSLLLKRFPIDIIKKENRYEVIAELPGVTENEATIEVTRDTLAIKVNKNFEKAEEKSETKETHVLKERRDINVYERRLALPKDVDLDKVEATFENGLLRVSLPMSEEEKPREIKVAVKNKSIEA